MCFIKFFRGLGCYPSPQLCVCNVGVKEESEPRTVHSADLTFYLSSCPWDMGNAVGGGGAECWQEEIDGLRNIPPPTRPSPLSLVPSQDKGRILL